MGYSNAKRTAEQKQEIIDYYSNHSESETLSQFHLAGTTFLNILKEFNVARRSAAENKKLTCLHKFGTEYAAQSPIVKQHIQETCMDRYGVDNFAKSDLFNDCLKNSSQAKYGVDNPMQSDIARQHLKETLSKKTEDDWKAINDKRTQTCLDKYGVPHVMYVDEFKQHQIDTTLSKYGVPHNMQNEDIRNRMNEHLMEEYGVMWPCQLPQVKRCYHQSSTVNQLFEQYLIDNNINIVGVEVPIKNRNYDFEVDNNILLEVNPTISHNSTFSIWKGTPVTSKQYHYEKSLLAKDNNYRCIHVWDWDNLSILLKLLQPSATIYARKCCINEVSIEDAKSFIDEYHLQGYVKDSIRIGLYYENNLVSIMTFGKPRYNNNYEWELLRYCSSCKIIGGAEKLFSYFINTYLPDTIISYCDFSKFTGSTYIKLGFKFDNISISKHWYNMKTKKHITDNLLRQRGYDQLFNTNYGKGTSNEQLMLENGFVEIYDAGQITYSWKRNKEIK